MTNDLRLQLISGIPLYVQQVGNVYPPKIRDIGTFGESRYNKCLGLITATLNDLDISLEEDTQITYFDYLIFTCVQAQELRDDLESFLKLILKKEVVLVPEYHFFLVGEYEDLSNIKADELTTIDRDNFDSLVDLVRLFNGLKKPKNTKPKKQVNKKILELQKKRAKGQKLLAEAKGTNLSLADLISALAVLYNDLNKVLDLTIFQLNDQYERYMRKEKYSSEFAMYLQGADAKSLDINTHWSSRKLEKEELPPNQRP